MSVRFTEKIPIDLAHLPLTFRGVTGNRTWLTQQWGMPSEKHSQQYERQREPHGKPDQRAAEDLFGTASVTQGPQQERKKQAYLTIAEIEGKLIICFFVGVGDFDGFGCHRGGLRIR